MTISVPASLAEAAPVVEAVAILDPAVADVALLFVGDETADFVAFLGNLPGDVADESLFRDLDRKNRMLHGSRAAEC